MNKTVVDKNDIRVLSACDVDENSLFEFYKQAFPKRIHSLKTDWKWLNRTGFHNNEAPLVLTYKGQVIAHSGIMPFNFSLNGKITNAAWFIDFYVLDQYQRQGLGAIINKKWMEIPACTLASPCNEGSIAVFKKSGWEETPDSYMHYNILLPFNHPRFEGKLPKAIKIFLNAFAHPLYFTTYKKNAYPADQYKFRKFNEELFQSFLKLCKSNSADENNTFYPIRNQEYIDWRILKSPNKNKYFFYEVEGFQALVLPQNGAQKHIDILWVSDTNNKQEISKMISSLGLYGIKKGYSYIRFYSTKKEVSGYVKLKTKSALRHPRFAYMLKDKDTFKLSGKLSWDLQLLDNDFENFY